MCLLVWHCWSQRSSIGPMRLNQWFPVDNNFILLVSNVQERFDVLAHHHRLSGRISLLLNDGVGNNNFVFKCGVHSRPRPTTSVQARCGASLARVPLGRRLQRNDFRQNPQRDNRFIFHVVLADVGWIRNYGIRRTWGLPRNISATALALFLPWHFHYISCFLQCARCCYWWVICGEVGG